ncbi:hypothetical protein U9M48_040984 [Paspalum notatum var. saurae]|uniref:Uncharacterized protein n=1 Tax=Paspalum notatum var. saurae TaxID=547442 RepID=A0AAQ3XG36_PASNO
MAAAAPSGFTRRTTVGAATANSCAGLRKVELQELIQAGVQMLTQVTARLNHQEDEPRLLTCHQDGGAGGNPGV